jgi:hypothetical protein
MHMPCARYQKYRFDCFCSRLSGSPKHTTRQQQDLAAEREVVSSGSPSLESLSNQSSCVTFRNQRALGLLLRSTTREAFFFPMETSARLEETFQRAKVKFQRLRQAYKESKAQPCYGLLDRRRRRLIHFRYLRARNEYRRLKQQIRERNLPAIVHDLIGTELNDIVGMTPFQQWLYGDL